jgi:acetyl esterase/lipase/lysophospholipase L1-like esterase
MKKIIVFLFVSVSYAAAQQVISLYEGTAPGSEKATWQEQTSTKNMFNTEVIYNVSSPTITAYLPPNHLNTGTAIIVAPGGAFHTLSINSEGREVAKWLNSKGIAAFVLKYRVAPSFTEDPVKELMAKMGDFKKLDEENAPYVPLAMADGLKAIAYVRAHASALDIDVNKIGIMGFSAGGTLAMSVAYNAAGENSPNFVAPIYAYEPAVIGSVIPKAKTPIFLVVAGDDQLKMMPMSISIYKKWFDAGQPAELHIYEKGGHGFGMNTQKLPVDTWEERFGDWLKNQGYLKKRYPNKYDKLYGEDAVAEGAIKNKELLVNDFGFLSKYKAKNKLLAANSSPKKRVVFIGDSITEGWFNTDSSFFISNNYLGRGISGQTSAQLLVRFRQDVINLKPHAVLIHIGTNDIAENTGPYNQEFTLANIASMVDLAKANYIKPYIASVLPATKFEWRLALGDRSAEIVALNLALAAYAKAKKIPFIDYHQVLKNSANGMDLMYAEDGVHPTPKAFSIMGTLVQKALNLP